MSRASRPAVLAGTTVVAMLLGQAGCGQPEAAAAAPEPPVAASAAPPKPESPGDDAGACVPDPLAAEERVVLTRLRQRRLEIEARSVELDKRQQQIEAIERAATALLGRVEAANKQLEVRLGVGRGNAEARAAQVARLSETLRSMKPKQAAELVGGLDRQTAAPLLRAMGTADVARLLATLRPEKAADLAAMLVEAPTAPLRPTPTTPAQPGGDPATPTQEAPVDKDS